MSSIISALKQSDIFYQFTPTQLELVANLCRDVVFSKGEMVFEENSSSKELYVIAGGNVNILINSSVGKKGTVVAVLRRGQSFGEVALVDEGLRSASASAGAKDTHLVIIPRDRLLMLCETYPQLGYRLMYNLSADLAMKIRNTDLRIRDQVLYTPPQK